MTGGRVFDHGLYWTGLDWTVPDEIMSSDSPDLVVRRRTYGDRNLSLSRLNQPRPTEGVGREWKGVEGRHASRHHGIVCIVAASNIRHMWSTLCRSREPGV